MGEEVAEYNGAYKVSQGMLDEFGLDRIRACVPGEGGPLGMIERLKKALADHLDGGVPEDDVTLLCLQRKGSLD